MNWARDNASLSDADLKTVFRYEPRETTVVRLLARTNWKADISSLESDKQWSNWIEKELPSIDNGDSGLVLLLAKRCGEPSLQGIQKAASDDWLDKAQERSRQIQELQRAPTFAPFGEKSEAVNATPKPSANTGRRGVRTLPFAPNTFRAISQSFHVHGSIARVISRADVPVFTCEKVNMVEPAYIYNCRSSNAWAMDLALTVTHYPNRGLTFALLLGCTFEMEKEIITRLSYVTSEATHPLLLPGIFAEIERVRAVKLVEKTVNRIEAQIFELDFQSMSPGEPQGADAQARSREKRTAYLDLGYLRNALVSWKRQLEKMMHHSQQLLRESNGHDGGVLFSPGVRRPRRSLTTQLSESDFRRSEIASRGNADSSPSLTPVITVTEDTSPEGHLDRKLVLSRERSTSDPVEESENGLSTNTHEHLHVMRTIGQKITSRIMVIMDEYDDKIRDCTMRVEGMAMATQWSQGETNMEIALATNRDSRHMRSIALVTMIFLPGTFFASMFSMTFFNWSDDPESTYVSKYLWIYILITVMFTALTIGVWYYVVVLRPKKQRNNKDEEDVRSFSLSDLSFGKVLSCGMRSHNTHSDKS
ncbi:hypothetical protein P280DRAFT_523289 [Massarina eburnea CBS 473.64]|uniref:Cora-domain-containing protein n=1 Tax=Massarina eburnea CBS 473.64 TaxID=1395130 RepID=A0A6A6RIV1_9PLEO|nr:hypothetical protein P280DRAFT_523289 [Massarina eburnea CBS 473.64]